MSSAWEKVRVVIPPWDDDFYLWGNLLLFAWIFGRMSSGGWFSWHIIPWYVGLVVLWFSVGWFDAWHSWAFAHPDERHPRIRDHFRF